MTSSIVTSSSATGQSSSPSKPEGKTFGNQMRVDRTRLQRQSSSSGQNFRIDVSPPRTVSSSSSDIDEIVRRLSNTDSMQELPQREASMSSFDGSESTKDSERNNQFNDVMERARRKS
jgi:hypothetical protein